MSKSAIIALLDRPGPKSLGMVGFLVDRGEQGAQVEGLLSTPLKRDLLAHIEVEDLISGGHARRVQDLEIEDAEENRAALWVGEEFSAKADELGLKLPPMPKLSHSQDGGQLWIASTKHVWQVIDSWIVRAFRQVLKNENPDLADLMSWAMPDRIETRAAIWKTSSKSKQQDELAWWARLDSSSGRRQTEPQTIESEIRVFIDKYRSQRLPMVLGFAAPAKGGDKEVAQRIAQQYDKATSLSFGTWLKNEAVREHVDPVREELARRGQAIINAQGALPFCLDVLSMLPSISIPNSEFIIEGIRHLEVHDVLLSLVGDDRFQLIHVDIPVQEQIDRLMKDESLSRADAVARVNDPTEREISILQKRASLKLNGMREIESNTNEVLRLAAI